MSNTDAPDIAERYLTATQSSNLRCETRDDAPVGAAGLLIAAGWSPARLGLALMRLQTKPDRAGLEAAHVQLSLIANNWAIPEPGSTAAKVLGWWLAKTCQACHGRKFELILDTPTLSTKQCKPCRGTGEAALGYGQDGRRLVDYLDYCRNSGAATLGPRLRQHG